MSKVGRLTVVMSLTAILAGLPLFAMAQEPPHQPPKKPGVQGQPHQPGAPGQGQHPGPAQGAQVHPGGPAAAQFHGPGPGGPGHAAHAIGERGYSFRGAGGGRRDIATFNPRERAIWGGGHWLHEQRFGRLGYWWEVNGAWYYYDQPHEGPPAYVSEVEFMDEGLDGPVVVAPAPVVVVAPPPVVYVRPPPPPVVCVGPLCVR